MTDIFISYSRADRDKVRVIAEGLTSQGLNVWWDTEIPPGSTFAEVIDQRLKAADCVLVVWSETSVQSNWVQEEADDGLSRRRLIPVMIDKIDLPRGFKRVQCADLTEWAGDPSDPQWQMVLAEVRRMVGAGDAPAEDAPAAPATTYAPPPPPPPAREAYAPPPEPAPEPEARPTPRPSPFAQDAPPRASAPQPEPDRASGGGGLGLVIALVLVLIAALGGGGYWFFLRGGDAEPPARIAEAASETRGDAPDEPAATADPAPSASYAPEAAVEVEDETREPDPAISEPVQAETLEPAPAATVAEETPPGAAPGETFQDCASCPEMTVLPAGSSVMGAPANERSRDDTELPQIEIAIAAPFAIGKTEVTFDQYAACVEAGGCASMPADTGFGRGARPVINISRAEAERYAAWLSAETGASYRLPSEAEWEYAARAGARGPFWHGDTISTRQANFNGQYPYGDGAKEPSVGRTLPVASFAANGFGLHDVHGNVWEWVADCWRPNHKGAPTDGSPVGGSCGEGVIKGGAWNGGAWRTRSAHRRAAATSKADYTIGFRVARDL